MSNDIVPLLSRLLDVVAHPDPSEDLQNMWSIQSTTRSKRSEERLQLRLDEAEVNKKVNEVMEAADRRDYLDRTRQNSNLAPKTDILSSVSSRSGSRSSSNVSPRTQPTAARTKKIKNAGTVILGGGVPGDAKDNIPSRRRSSPEDVAEGYVAGPSKDAGRYQIRCYRRETQQGDEWRVFRVRQYMYWAPK